MLNRRIGFPTIFGLVALAQLIIIYGLSDLSSSSSGASEQNNSLTETETAWLLVFIYLVLCSCYLGAAFYLEAASQKWPEYFLNDADILSLPEFHDSFYYLGFIGTLGSLSMSIYALAASSTSGDWQTQIKVAFAQSGIALVSTVFGLVFRNILTYATVENSSDPSDVLLEIEDRLNGVRKQLKKLSDETEQANIALNTHSGVWRQMHHVIKETTIFIRDNPLDTKAYLRDTANVISSAKFDLEMLSTLASQLEDELRSISSGVRQGGSDVSKSITQAVHSLQSAAQKIDGVSADINRVGKVLGQATDEAVKTASRDRQRVIETSKDLDVSFNELARFTIGLAEVVATQTKQLEELKNLIQRAS